MTYAFWRAGIVAIKSIIIVNKLSSGLYSRIVSSNMDELKNLEHTIAALENQRSILGDMVVDAALAPLRARLAELQTRVAGEQRKLVTILFADLVGSTPMTEALDPEDVREILNTYFARWNTHIQENSGVVEKYIGDAVMAVFGLATAREDDPERALRAALAMQHSLADLNQTFEQDWGIELSMRVGVHTGQVVISTLDERQGQEFVVVGEAVNLASRLQSHAPPDALIISHDTYQLVRGVFEVRPLEKQQVKGFSEPVQPYLVLREKPRAFRMGRRGLEGVDTRMVGRERELQRLQEALFTVIESGYRQFILLSGEAGVGKSRLIYEFDKWLDLIPEKVRYFKGRASPEMAQLPYTLLRDVFSFRFEIQDSDPPEVLCEKLERGIQAALDGQNAQNEHENWQRRAHYIGRLVGFEFGSSPHFPDEYYDAKSLHDQALVYLNDYFKALSEQMPLVILLEDLHWADDSSLDIIHQLGLALAHFPVMIVCSARPALFERRPHWGAEQPALTRLDLGQLSPTDSRLLVNEILQKVEAVPDQLLDLVLSNAEGNPYYIEELIKMLIEIGVIRTGEKHWKVEISRLSAASIPSTLVGVLQARLDSLQDVERLCLQRAAVIGRIFWAATVAYLEEKSPDNSRSEAALQNLHHREMIFKRGTSAFADTVEYLFKHTLLRDVAYQSLLKNHRRVYHARTARWLESVTAETGRTDEYAALIARHYDEAGESGLAANLYRRAGKQAAAQFANTEAVDYFRRALLLTPESDRSGSFDLYRSIERIHDIQGAREAQAQDLVALDNLAQYHPTEQQAEVALRRAHYAEVTGDFPAAITAAEAAIMLAQASQSTSLEALCYLQLGNVLLQQGDFGAAQNQFEHTLGLAQSTQSYDIEANALRNLGNAALRLGQYASAVNYYESALHIFRSNNDREGQALVLGHLGNLAIDQSAYEDAINYLKEAFSIFREIGFRRGEANTLNSLGLLAAYRGHYQEALDHYKNTLTICREIGDRQGVGLALMNIGHVSYLRQDYSFAKHNLEQALPISRAIGDRRIEGLTLLNLGYVNQCQAEYTEALNCLNEGLKICQEIGDRQKESWGLGVLGYVYESLGAYSKAQDCFNQALQLLRELGDRLTEGWRLSDLALVAHHTGDDIAASNYSQEALKIARHFNNQPLQAYALVILGHALAGLDQLAESDIAYQESIAVKVALDQLLPAVEALAGRARLALAQQDLERASENVETIIDHLQHHAPEGFDELFLVYLTCYQVLQAKKDPRAKEVLMRAHSSLQARAARISDPDLRRSFLENISAHRQLARAWQIESG